MKPTQTDELYLLFLVFFFSLLDATPQFSRSPRALSTKRHPTGVNHKSNGAKKEQLTGAERGENAREPLQVFPPVTPIDLFSQLVVSQSLITGDVCGPIKRRQIGALLH